MAIKADRQQDAVELSYYLNETAVKGKILVVSTAGSGVAMDNSRNVATVAANSSGNKPIGALLTEFVYVDQTRYPINWHKDQAQSGDKAAIMTKGWIVTDQITGTVTAGNHAVLGPSGTVMDGAPNNTWNAVANPRVGRFRSTQDESGFAKLYVDL